MPAQPLPILLRGRPLAEGRLPAVCAPLVARTQTDLIAETRVVAAKGPDLLEWRVDFFEGIADTAQVLEAARALKDAAGGIPVLFTRRSTFEGGQSIPLEEAEVVALYEAVIASGTMDLVDYEMARDPAHIAAVRTLARQQGVGLVLSFHDFGATPADETLAAKFALAESLGADVAKLAVMPRDMQDVHRLLGATLAASREHGIPVVSMAMGGLGAVTRVAGGVYGSALTFAVGAAPSAPGQMPIADVRSALEVLDRANPN